MGERFQFVASLAGEKILRQLLRVGWTRMIFVLPLFNGAYTLVLDCFCDFGGVACLCRKLTASAMHAVAPVCKAAPRVPPKPASSSRVVSSPGVPIVRPLGSALCGATPSF